MTQLSTLADQHRHYSAVRARLYGAPQAVCLVPRIKLAQIEATTPVEPIEPACDTCPINMLTLPSWRFLLALAALRRGVTVDQILSRSRNKKVCEARHDAAALIYSHQRRSTPEVGRMLGRDASSVLHSIQLRDAKPLPIERPQIAPVPDVPARLVDTVDEPEPAKVRSLEEVEEENRHLRELMGLTPKFDFLMRCKNLLDLTPARAKLLAILVEGKVRTHEGLYGAYCHAMGTEPGASIIGALITSLRHALSRYGVTIHCVWGEGFYMTEKDRKRVRQILGMEAAGL